MNIAVGLMERQDSVSIELLGSFVDGNGKTHLAGRHRFTDEIELTPSDPASSFALDDMTIGIGFHWERRERQVFRGAVRLIRRTGLTVVNDVSIEEYVTSVISSEMSALCPLEFLKAHAVISRSWLWFPKTNPEAMGSSDVSIRRGDEILRWYGREAHRDFDVCADDHCQRYQGVTKAYSPTVAQAVSATAGQMLTHDGNVCDARFSKCCGGITEVYRSAWEDRDAPYLKARFDGDEERELPGETENWILSDEAPAYCNTRDSELLSEILPGFDQETRDFYRWTVKYSPQEIRELVRARLGDDVGTAIDLVPMERGPSGRIVRLYIEGRNKSIIVGKELEIRRVLSQTHLYSSAFVVQREGQNFVLKGAGWGHGVGLCQIGAAVMASRGKKYDEILRHYYEGTSVGAVISFLPIFRGFA